MTALVLLIALAGGVALYRIGVSSYGQPGAFLYVVLATYAAVTLGFTLGSETEGIALAGVVVTFGAVAYALRFRLGQ